MDSRDQSNDSISKKKKGDPKTIAKGKKKRTDEEDEDESNLKLKSKPSRRNKLNDDDEGENSNGEMSDSSPKKTARIKRKVKGDVLNDIS
jgi:hypothetical protein